MSLKKWQKLAKSKTNLGNQINRVHDAIKKTNINQQTNQTLFKQMFEPVTGKLDEVIESNLNTPPIRKKSKKKGKTPHIDYYPEVDPFEGMDVEGLLDDDRGYEPYDEKQIPISPPPYAYKEPPAVVRKVKPYDGDQSFGEMLDSFEEPPEYDYEEDIDYGLQDSDAANMILDDLNVINYDDLDKSLSEIPSERGKRTKLTRIIKYAESRRNQLKGYKSDVTKRYNKGEINDAEKQLENRKIDIRRSVLNKYISDNKKKLKTIQGSGVHFYNNPKQLVKQLELIIGEMIAGNNSIKMRNTGQAILDTLLKTSVINKKQYTKMFNNYFKI